MDCNMPGSSVNFFQSLLKFMSIELEMLPNHLILCHPILIWWLPSCRASGSFPVSQLFTSSWKYSAYPPRAWDWEKGKLYRIKLELVAWKMVDFMDSSLLLFPCLCSPDSWWTSLPDFMMFSPAMLFSVNSPIQSAASNAPLSFSTWQIPTYPGDSDSQKTEHLSFLQHSQAELNALVFMMLLYFLHIYSIRLSLLP